MSMALPLQLDMMALLGCDRIPQRSDDPEICKDVMWAGRVSLIKSTNVDFGYDVDAWRKHLMENHRDGYDGWNSFDNYIKEKLLDDDYANRLLAELEVELSTELREGK